MKALTIAFAALLAVPAFASEGAFAQERTVKITGFGAKSGVVRVFGVNSEAAMKAAAEEINKAGGVTLGDGSKAKLAVEFLDDRCNAEEGISVVRRIASSDAFVAVGPSTKRRIGWQRKLDASRRRAAKRRGSAAPWPNPWPGRPGACERAGDRPRSLARTSGRRSRPGRRTSRR